MIPAVHKVSLFIPVFNEERILSRNIRLIDHVVSKMSIDYEIFIVNDASRDATEQIAWKIERTCRKIVLLNYTRGPTRRENLATSFHQATGDIIVYLDSDVLPSLRSLSDLIEQVILGCDIAIGSRYAKGSKIKRKLLRLLISVAYNFCIRVLFRTRIQDHQCGFKAFRKDVAMQLVNEMGYDETLRRGFFWDAEFLVRALRHGYKVKEIPIAWRERNKTSLSFARELRAVGPMVSLFWRYGLGKHWTPRLSSAGS